MFCPNCGTKTEEHQNFCSECGHSFESWSDPPAISSNTESSSTEITKRKGHKLWFYLIFLLTLALMLWGFYSWNHSEGALEEVAKLQLHEIQKNQLTKAYYEYSSSQFKTNTSLENFRNYINQHPSLKEFSTVTFHNIQRDNNYGVALGELSVFDDLTVPIKYEFVKEDGEWRVLKLSLDSPQMMAQSENLSDDEAIITPITSQLQAIKQGKIQLAYNQFTSKDFKHSTELALFQNFIEQNPNLASFDNIELTGFDQTKDQAKVNLTFYNKNKALNIEYTLKKENGSWKIWSLQVIKEQASKEIEKAVTQPIKVFIQMLNQGDLKKAYEQTSPQFRKTTSFEKFQTFISKFPKLKDQDITFLQSSQDKNLGLVRVQSNEQGQNALIDYTLAKEGNDWTILGIEILNTPFLKQDHAVAKPVIETNEPEFDQSFLIKIIEEQLNKIRNKDLHTAYENYTAKEFKEATSYDIFAKFINQNAIYSNNKSAKFGNLTFDNNVATIKGVLLTNKGEQGIVEYDLIKQDNLWKILGIKILAAKKDTLDENTNGNEIKEIIH